jgi:dTDP-4-amino-4,6-dideoxygalactose transaminase
VQAAIGIAQLEKLDRLLYLRAEVAGRYGELLANDDVEPSATTTTTTSGRGSCTWSRCRPASTAPV